MTYCVVYQSNTGFTKQYAEWIATELCCEIKSLSEFKKTDNFLTDFLIYGGWICADSIKGIAEIQKFGRKPDVVFAVGAAPQNDEKDKMLSIKNHLETIPFFYFQGGIRFEKLSLTQKSMLKMYEASLKRNVNKTNTEIEIEKALAHSYDLAKREAIFPMIQKCKTMNSKDHECRYSNDGKTPSNGI